MKIEYFRVVFRKNLKVFDFSEFAHFHKVSVDFLYIPMSVFQILSVLPSFVTGNPEIPFYYRERVFSEFFIDLL